MEVSAGALEGGANEDPLRSRQAQASDGLDAEVFTMAQTLVGSRQNVAPKRLVVPGHSPTELDALLALAAAAPDHGQLTPWRFIIVPEAQRHCLRALCGLMPGEVLVCCVDIGTVSRRKGPPRLRPLLATFVSELGVASVHGSV
jgi:hypothetical protein